VGADPSVRRDVDGVDVDGHDVARTRSLDDDRAAEWVPPAEGGLRSAIRRDSCSNRVPLRASKVFIFADLGGFTR